MKNEYKFSKEIITITLALVIIGIIFILNFGDYKFKGTMPVCKDGFIDLTDWNFIEDGNVKLRGSWEFYPNKLLYPEDFKNKILSSKEYIKVPSRWVKALGKEVISDKAVGTYRLRVQVNNNINMYGLKTMNIRSACKIFVNGKEVAKSGNPTLSLKDGYVTNVLPTTSFFPSEGNTIEIVIQVANLEYVNGGIIQDITLGSEKNILAYHIESNIVDTMGFSFFIITSIYYFSIYIKRRQDKYLLYCSILCFTCAFTSASANEKIFNQLMPFIPFFTIIKLRVISITLGAPLLCLFIRKTGRDFIKEKCIKAIMVITSINIFIAVIIPTKIMIFSENMTGLLVITIYVIVSSLMIKIMNNKKQKASHKKLALSLFIIILMVIFQSICTILYYYSIINSNVVPTFTVLMLLVGINTIISDEYVNAYSDLEVMSLDLIAANELKDEFLINTSHEFKTPLHAIINISKSLLNKAKENPEEKYRENLNYIVAIATRLSSLVNDIIDFGNLENKSLKLNNKVFDINGIVQVVIEILWYMKKSEDIKLINNVPKDKYYVYADENRLKQILVNLIGNSLKFTDKGYVEIKGDYVDSYVNIIVKDTGKGMNEKTKERLFQRNMYGDGNDSTEYSSSGLGLSISKLLANSMEGDLQLKYSEPNEGSVFVLKLPKAKKEKIQATKNQTLRKIKNSMIIGSRNTDAALSVEVNCQDHGKQQKIKILVVDDESSNIKVLKEIFDDKHYEILAAYSGIKALEIIKEHKNIALVLLDVMMPEMSGYEVCRQIRQQYTLFELPILLLTVRNTPEDIEIGFKAGANDFLAKPFDSKELLARVRTLIELKKSVTKALDMEMAFLQAQIKPHFLFNVLNTIAALCYEKPEEASELIVELSNYLRCSFDFRNLEKFIPLEKEIEYVNSYLKLEKARFGEKLKIEYDIEANTEIMIPPLILQPIVENAVKHGIRGKREGGKITVCVKNQQEDTLIIVSDDGIGMSEEKTKELLNLSILSGSVGMKNIEMRLKRIYGRGMKVISTEGLGTEVVISIPKGAYHL